MRALPVLCLVLFAAVPVLALDPDLRELAKDPDSFKRSDAARKLGRDGSPEAAAILARMFSDKNPYVRDHAVISCHGLKDPKAVNALAGATRDRDALTRRNAADALGRTHAPAALPLLARLATKDRESIVRAQALDGLWGFRGNADALAICRDAVKAKDPLVRAAAVEAAGRIRGDEAAELVRQGLADEDEGVRCVARMELRFVARDDALAALAAGSKDPGWRTRAQVVEDALALRTVEAVDALVHLVGDDVLRVSAAAHEGLVALTGKEIGRDPELWRAWWKDARPEWKMPQGRLRKPGNEGRARTAASFHGIEVTGGRVAFVIDISGSMAEKMPEDPGERTRWEVVREELDATLERLPDSTYVNLLLFSTEVVVAAPGPVRLSPRDRKRFSAFARRAEPGGRGVLLAAVLAALEQDVDTVLLLTDGAPSAGELVDKDRVRRAIRQRNRMLKRRIHTVAFGSTKKTERRFMENVAADSGGRVVFR